MKKVLACLLTGISYLSVYSQSQINLIQGGEASTQRGVGYQKMIGADETGFYMLQQSSLGKGISFTVDKVDRKFNVIFSKTTAVEETQLSMKFPAYSPVECYYAAGKVFLFFYSHDKKQKKLYLFLQTVSSKGDLSQVYEVATSYLDYDKPYDIMGMRYFIIKFSADQSEFAVIPELGEQKDSGASSCRLYRSSDLQKLWEKTIPTKDQGTKIVTSDFAIDKNHGLVYTVKYPNYDKKRTINGFAVGILENNSPTPKTINVPFPENKVIHDYAIHSLNNGDILFAAIISDTLAKGEKTGSTNPSYILKKIKNYELTSVFEKQVDLPSDAKVKLGETERNGTFRNMEIVEMNNNIYVSTEHATERMFWSNGSIRFLMKELTEKELVVSKFSMDGEFAWTKVIPKLHKGTAQIAGTVAAPRYTGKHKTFVVDNKLCFVFLDNPENINLRANNNDPKAIRPISGSMTSPESLSAKDSESANTVLVQLDENGNDFKQKIMENTKEDVRYVALGSTVMLDAHSLLLFLENRKEKIERYAILEFK